MKAAPGPPFFIFLWVAFKLHIQAVRGEENLLSLPLYTFPTGTSPSVPVQHQFTIDFSHLKNAMFSIFVGLSWNVLGNIGEGLNPAKQKVAAATAAVLLGVSLFTVSFLPFLCCKQSVPLFIYSIFLVQSS